MMRKQIVLALASAACALATGAAHAGNVYWSVGINALPIGGVISNAPVYSAPEPVYYPAPAIYAPPPVVYAPVPRVVYRPPVYYRPAPVVVYGGGYRTGYRGDYYRHGRDHDHHDEYGDRHDGRWQPAPAGPRRQYHGERDR